MSKRGIPHASIITMSSAINVRALCREGCSKEALHILLTTSNPPTDSSTYLQLLQIRFEKNAISEGKLIHSFITDRGFTFATRTYFQTKLISIYVKCRSLVNARKLFDHMTERDVVSWNIIIAAYQRHGLPEEALTLFRQMQSTDVQPDHFTFASILPACAKMGALQRGMDIHQKITRSGHLSDVVVRSALIDMYAKCGSMQKARDLFDTMPERDVVSWTAMIVGYAQDGLVDKALETFKELQLTNVQPDQFTIACILSVCGKMGALEQGMDIHQSIRKSGFLSNVVVRSALIDMYAKCGSTKKARELFDTMPQRDVVSWNGMIAGYAQNGLVEKALEIFKQMQLAGVKPNSATFASILSVCGKMGDLEHGTDIHQNITRSGLMFDVAVGNALIDMYAKCGSIQKARELFDTMPQRDAVSWTVMVAGYAQNGVLDKALMLFKEMPQHDVVSWNAVVAGYAQNELAEKALESFKKMQLAGVKPDSATFATILPVCAKIGTLKQGMEFHQCIMKCGFMLHVAVGNALIDMYAKCGNIQKAHKLFDTMPQQNVVSWTTMIAGYGMHGYGEDALKLFELMKHSGTYPNHVSFLCVLFACSHVGLVDEGCKYFNSMNDAYCIMPTMDHYVCMVDLLGRAAYLEEALNIIIKMPIKPDAVVWMCFLGSCRSHKNKRLGEYMATLLFELDPAIDASYVLLSDIHAEIGNWADIQKLQRLMKDRGTKKKLGCSWIEIDKTVHTLCVRDASHL